MSNPNSLKDIYSFGSGSGLGVGFCSGFFSSEGFSFLDGSKGLSGLGGCQVVVSMGVELTTSTCSNSDWGVFPAIVVIRVRPRMFLRLGPSSALLQVTVLCVVRSSFGIGFGASVETESGFVGS